MSVEHLAKRLNPQQLRDVLRAQRHPDLAQRFDVNFVSPDGFWKSEEHMLQGTACDKIDDEVLERAYSPSVNSLRTRLVQWVFHEKPFICVGCSYQWPHRINVEKEKVPVRTHQVCGPETDLQASTFTANVIKLQCEGCGNIAAGINRWREKRSLTESKKAEDNSKEECDFTRMNKLSLAALKALCRAKHLFPSGTKADLVNRLMGCLRHGHRSECGKCKFPKLELVYSKEREDNKEDWETEPIAIQCTQTLMSNDKEQKCGWFNKITTTNKNVVLDFRLQDNLKGHLASVGIKCRKYVPPQPPRSPPSIKRRLSNSPVKRRPVKKPKTQSGKGR